jgi:multidrug resistance protein, MATE family
MGFLPDRQLTRSVLRTSLPAVAGLSSQMFVSVFETAMVGRLQNTTVVLAAMGLGVLISWAITSVFSSLATGTQVYAARRYGARDYAGVGAVLNNSLLLAFFLGGVFGYLGYSFSYSIIGFFSSDQAVAVAGTDYVRWRFIGLLPFLLVVAYRGFFNGIGHTKVFMYSAIIINVANILLNALLILGGFGIPAMGLSGAGAASAISNGIGLLFFVGVTFLPKYRRRYRYYSRPNISLELIRQIFRISAPVSFQNILILLGFLVFIAITGRIGTAQQAASQVVFTALFMSFLPCFGFGLGAQTLVGQALGTGGMAMAKKYGLEAARLATYFTMVLGALFIFVPRLVIMVITTNDEVIGVAEPVLRIAGAAQIFYASGIVLAHALQAAGATLYVMFIEVITHWVIFLPLSYVLGVTLGWGLTGAWMALPVYIVFYSLFIYLKYRGDRWLQLTL